MAAPGYTLGAASGPPPPPPPPVPGQVPALRINTASEYEPRGPHSDAYEPPAAIQNAMMTKDKKPFTYTPGMGGKLDLSQIRSPRMARRVAKNANDEGIEGPPKSALAQQPQQHQPTGIYAQPQVAVPVFPQGMSQQPPVHLRNSTLPRSLPGGEMIVPVIERQTEPAPRPVVKVETKMQPLVNSPDAQSPPISPTQVTLSKAPTPWMQKPTKPSEELPEWAKKPNNQTYDGSSNPLDYDFPTSNPPRVVVVTSPSKPQTQPPQYQQYEQPQQYQQPQQHYQQPQQQYQQPQQQYQQQQQQQQTRPQNERTVPIRIEDRPSVFSAMNEPGHHQLMNTAPHHQSRWGNPVGQSGYQQPQPTTHIIPIQFDGQPQYQVPDNQSNRNMRGYAPVFNQPEPGPVQSKSFRVLQKITDTDPDQINEEHLRKLQLNEEDKYLMNKFKEQVDGDVYLHKEEDPRYRGAAIPSRAFRYLQNMTDSGDGTNSNSTAAKTVSPATKKQNRNSKTFDEVTIPVQYVPASQQQVPEPKKYMGGAIPSRSFKILQAMTAPESIATQVTQENRQRSATDFIYFPVNQQIIHYPRHSHTIPGPPGPPAPAAPPLTIWYPKTSLGPHYSMSPHANYDLSHYPHNSDHHYHHHHHHYQPHLLSAGRTTCAPVDDSTSTAHFPFDHDPRPFEVGGNNSKEHVAAAYANSFSRIFHLYAGSQEKSNLSTTPPNPNTNTNSSGAFAAPPLPSLPSEHNSKPEEEEEEEEEDEEGEGEGEEDNDGSNSKGNNEEENASNESSDSGTDSDSFVGYSTGLNPLHQNSKLMTPRDVKDESEEKYTEDRDSTDCENETLLKDDFEEFGQQVQEDQEYQEDQDKEEEGKDRELGDQNENKNLSELVSKCESISSMTVNVSLPFRTKYSFSRNNENPTILNFDDSDAAKNIETSVVFTLKKPNRELEPLGEKIQSKPIFIVTTTEDDKPEPENPIDTSALSSVYAEEKMKTMLSVENHSKEDLTDDEDSGVTSDMSRIISEDTDSECCLSGVVTAETTTLEDTPTVKKSGNRKYYRTQTHSRLFKLVTDEHLLGSKLSSCEENSSNSSGLTSPDCSHVDDTTLRNTTRDQLPKRPKSLDCEALFGRQSQRDGDQDSYYQNWKSGERSSWRKSAAGAAQWTYPRVNVLCPRIRSSKHLAQASKPSHQFTQRKPSLRPSLMSSSSSSPSPLGIGKRC